MNKLLSFLTVLTFGFSYQICHEPTGSCYDVSTDQAFYFFETVTVDGELATPCGGSNAGMLGVYLIIVIKNSVSGVYL